VHADRQSEVIQCAKGRTGGGGPDVFVHISAVERAGLLDLNARRSASSCYRTREDEAANLKLA
jgi:cold shock CspA family protein